MDDAHTIQRTVRFGIALAILIAVIAYTVGVIDGAIPKARQLDGTNLTLLFLALIACAMILRPEMLDRLARFEGLGFKVELQRIQEDLYRLDLIVPLLFRDGERKHLHNLLGGETKNYRGGGVLRDELRRLRAIGLIKSLPDRPVADLHTNTEFDLAEWVQLTDFGRYWAQRLEKLGRIAIDEKTAADAKL